MKFWMDEEGAALAEYGLLLAAICVAVIAAAQLLGDSISGLFDELNTAIAAI